MHFKTHKLTLPVFFAILFVYLEVFFHIFMFHSVDMNLLYILLFSVMGGCLLGIILSLFKEKISFILSLICTTILCIFFCVEVVYQSVFQKFLALFSMLGVAGQAFDFMDVIIKNILANILILIILLLPIIALLLFKKLGWIQFSAPHKMQTVIPYIAGMICYGIAILMINFGSHTAYSAYDIYYNNVSADMTLQQFGVITMNRLDGLYAIFGRPARELQFNVTSADIESTEPTEPEEPEIDTSPNTMNIDFEGINASAGNDAVTQLSQYFQSQPGTNKNEYTDMFEGYNVIFITAEGFSRFVIDEERTPTLYKLKNEGFIFNNYYTPGWYASTSDGEFANLTGLLPVNGEVAMKSTGERGTNMYFTLGRQLQRKGYNLNGFHNNSYTYYGRELSHTNMGYNWCGTGNWFQPETNASGGAYWPQSDLQLITQSMSMYMDAQPFHTYYMTVSGHMLYSQDGNQMCYQNYELVKDLPYSETTKCYLACQMELEKAMTALVNELEARGIADKTLIVLGADHIPYNDKPVCDELAGYELNPIIDWYQNDLIIWSASMEEPIEVDKYCYAVDILPTVSNLLGLEYDSRLLIGQDILSDSEQLVCFPDRSFISGKCIYNASNGSVTPLTDEEVTQEYIDAMSGVVYNKFTVSEMILDTNYYQYIEGNVK